MKEFIKKLLTVLIIFLSVLPVKAIFVSRHGGVTSAAVGGSGQALPVSVYSPLDNPAQLAEAEYYSAGGEYYMIFPGAESYSSIPGWRSAEQTAQYFSIHGPLRGKGALAVSALFYGSPSNYVERAFIFSASRSMGDIVSLFSDENISAGINLKTIYRRYYSDEYTEEFFNQYGESSAGVTADAGILYRKGANISIGLTFKNFLPADMGIIEEDNISPSVDAGAKLRVIKKLDVYPAVKSTGGKLKPSGGISYTPYETRTESFSILAGVNGDYLSCAVSAEFMSAALDYSFILPYRMSDVFSHRVGVSYRWK